jgi:F-type H+-transporting ATPase subunit epsilon
MNLKVLLPTAVLVDTEVTKVVAEAANGSFCLLPRHIDIVAALVPGLFFYTTAEGQEVFLAVDEGILVKCGAEVLVSTRNAVQGPDLGTLERTIDEQFRVLDEHEKMARTAMARLEADLVRRFMELHEHGS